MDLLISQGVRYGPAGVTPDAVDSTDRNGARRNVSSTVIGNCSGVLTVARWAVRKRRRGVCVRDGRARRKSDGLEFAGGSLGPCELIGRTVGESQLIRNLQCGACLVTGPMERWVIEVTAIVRSNEHGRVINAVRLR